jgi:hypothetical protein
MARNFDRISVTAGREPFGCAAFRDTLRTACAAPLTKCVPLGNCQGFPISLNRRTVLVLNEIVLVIESFFAVEQEQEHENKPLNGTNRLWEYPHTKVHKASRSWPTLGSHKESKWTQGEIGLRRLGVLRALRP